VRWFWPDPQGIGAPATSERMRGRCETGARHGPGRSIMAVSLVSAALGVFERVVVVGEQLGDLRVEASPSPRPVCIVIEPLVGMSGHASSSIAGY
jgi:hypothetical protein